MTQKNKTKTTKKQKTNIEYDTKMGTFEKTYGIELNVPSNTKFGTYLNNIGYGSLADMLRT